MPKGYITDLISVRQKGHLIRAAMEGVAYSLKHNLDIGEKTGAKVEELLAMGGICKLTSVDTDQM